MNNAGLGPIDGVPAYLEEQPIQFIDDLVTINCLMPTMVSKHAPVHHLPSTGLDGLAWFAPTWSCPKGKQEQQMQCMNCTWLQLTKMVLAGMRERKRGLIINVGSIIANFDAPLVAGENNGSAQYAQHAGHRLVQLGAAAGHNCLPFQGTVHVPQPCTSATPALLPPASAYGASKKFLDNLSVSVNAEYAQFGVRVQNLWAGSVATKMPGIK